MVEVERDLVAVERAAVSVALARLAEAEASWACRQARREGTVAVEVMVAVA